MTVADKFRKANQIYFLVECDFDGVEKRWAEKDIHIGSDVYFEGKITSIGNTGTSFNLRTMQLAMAGVSVTIANDDRVQDIEVNRVLDGSLCNVYVYCDGMTWAEITTYGLILTGSFKKENHTRTSYSFSIEDATRRRMRTIPGAYINDDNFSSHRKEGGGGSVSGKPLPLIFGDFPSGIPLLCTDTASFKYAVALGQVKSTDAEYTATTENVYDKDGSTIAAANYTMTDGIVEGIPYTYFDFTGDQASNEPLSCSIQAIKDGGGVITGTAAELIEHPAYTYHYLINQYAIDLDPDLESIGTIKASLPYIKFASYINAATNAAEVAQRILSQAFCSIAIRNGKMGAMVFNPDAEAGKHYSQVDHHIGGDVVFNRTDIENICNKLIVNYAPNMTTGKYEGQIVKDRTNHDGCALSYYQYGERPAVTLDLPDVNNEIVAGALANKYLDIHSHRHDIVSMMVGYGDGFDDFEGDAALWTIPDGPSTDGSGWHDEKMILLDRNFTRDGIVQRYWRVAHNVNYIGE